jgi:hypothetical protein
MHNMSSMDIFPKNGTKYLSLIFLQARLSHIYHMPVLEELAANVFNSCNMVNTIYTPKFPTHIFMYSINFTATEYFLYINLVILYINLVKLLLL